MTLRPDPPTRRCSSVVAGAALALVSAGLPAARADAPDRLADASTPAASPTREAVAIDGLTAFIDAQIDARLSEQKLKPSAAAGDAEFLRRASLDLTGKVPSADEAVAFIKDRDPKKREKKIDALLADPAWAENWAEVWTALLTGRSGRFQDVLARRALLGWLKDAFARNTPLDALVRSLLTAKGRTDENPAVLYLLRFRDSPLDAVGHVTRVFCGVQMQCAQCHNHPYEKWTQEDFFGVAGFLARTRGRVAEKMEKGPPILELFDAPRGEATIPDSKPAKSVPPKFMTGETPAPKEIRREELARILTSPSNPSFAKAMVNRVWYQCFGRGLVEPVDDFRASDPGTHPELLDGMARAFAQGGHDAKALLRAILNSRAYQRAARAAGESAEDHAYYTHALLRAMTPEQLFDSLMLATGADALGRARNNPEAVEQLKQRVLQRFVYLFANEEMQEVTDFEGTIPQALLMLNGQFTNGMEGRYRPAPVGGKGKENGKGAAAARAPSGKQPAIPRVEALLREHAGAEDRLAGLFLHILSRPPGAEERSRYLAYLRRGGDSAGTYEDIAWTLLNSTEFLYNH